MAETKWTNRLARWSLWVAVAALLIAFTGLTLARYDLVPKINGLYAMLGGGLVAALGAVIALIAVIMAIRFRASALRLALVGLVISAGYVGYMASRAAVARSVPPLHDISTDLADPPAFGALSLRSDNLAGVETIENWRAQHAAAYGDIDSITIARPVAQVVADAERLAKARGWDVAYADTAQGRVEATVSVSYIRFKDDVVIRVATAPDGTGSVVDMRSVSRIGVSDLGMNAARIREFLAALAAG